MPDQPRFINAPAILRAALPTIALVSLVTAAALTVVAVASARLEFNDLSLPGAYALSWVLAVAAYVFRGWQWGAICIAVASALTFASDLPAGPPGHVVGYYALWLLAFVSVISARDHVDLDNGLVRAIIGIAGAWVVFMILIDLAAESRFASIFGDTPGFNFWSDAAQFQILLTAGLIATIAFLAFRPFVSLALMIAIGVPTSTMHVVGLAGVAPELPVWHLIITFVTGEFDWIAIAIAAVVIAAYRSSGEIEDRDHHESGVSALEA